MHLLVQFSQIPILIKKQVKKSLKKRNIAYRHNFKYFPIQQFLISRFRQHAYSRFSISVFGKVCWKYPFLAKSAENIPLRIKTVYLYCN